MCAASSPSRRSPKRMSYSHTAHRSSYASRTALRNRGSRGVYSLTFLPLRGMGSSSPREDGPAASRTAARMSRWIDGGKCSARIWRAARGTSSGCRDSRSWTSCRNPPVIRRRFASATRRSAARPVDSCDSSGISHRRSSFRNLPNGYSTRGRRARSSEFRPEFLESLVRSLIRDEPTRRPQPDTAERQQQHQRLVGCPAAMASINPDGGQAFEELVGGHDDTSW